MSEPARPGLHERAPVASEAGEALVASLVRLALTEDVGTGDATTLAAVEPERTARGLVHAKENGVLSGVAAARETARAVDPGIDFHPLLADGAALSPGDRVLELRGSARGILTMERVLLNFLQRLSGVATLTRRYVDAVAGTGVRIADTRKTTPGLRYLEKAAVRHGGGINHRMGLYDAFLVKDNHIVAAGGITRAVERVRAGDSPLFLIVEVRTPEEVAEVAGLAVDQILLDNMAPEEIARAVETIRRIEAGADLPRAWIEVSGGIDLETVRAKALPGVDLISVGALTHSAPAIDLSLELELGASPNA